MTWPLNLLPPRGWQILLTCYWLVLFAATHVPRDFPALPGGRVAALAHVAAYALLAGLLAVTWQRSAGLLTVQHLRWVWIVLMVYAALDELTQIPVGRDGNVRDWCADAIGALIGLAVFYWLFAQPPGIRERRDQ